MIALALALALLAAAPPPAPAPRFILPRPDAMRAGPLLAIAQAPDGAVAIADARAVRAFDAQGAPRFTLDVADLRPRALAFLRGGAQLLVAGQRGLALFELPSRKLILRSDPEQVVRDIALSADGALAAIGSAQGSVQLLRLDAPEQPARALSTDLEIRGLALSPDGALLAIAGERASLRLFALPDLKPVRELRPRRDRWEPADAIDAVTFAPSGALVGLDGRGQALWIWADPRRGAPRRVDAPGTRSFAFRLSPDGRRVALGRADQTVLVVSLETGAVERRLCAEHYRALAWSGPDALLLPGREKPFESLALEAAPKDPHCPGASEALLGLALSPRGDRVATASRDVPGEELTLRVFDAASGEQRVSQRAGGPPTGAVAFGPDGASLSWAEREWRLSEGDGTLAAADSARRGAAPSPGEGAPSWSAECSRAALRDPAGKELRAYPLEPTGGGEDAPRPGPAEFCEGSLSPDGRFGAAWSPEELRVYDLQADALAYSAKTGFAKVLFDPRWLAIALLEADEAASAVTVLDPRSGEERRRFKWPIPRGLAVLLPGGEVLAFLGADGQVHRLDLRQGAELPALGELPCEVAALAASSDGSSLAAGCRSGAIALWRFGAAAK